MLACNIMTSPAVTVAPDATVADVARTMAERGVSGLPVVDASGRLVGMVTEGDLLRRKELGSEMRRSWWVRLFRDDKSLAGEFARAHGRFVRGVMTRNVVCVRDDTPVGRVAELLSTLDVKRLPVLKDGAIVGVVARRDVIRALAKLAEAEPQPHTASDDEIARCLLRSIDRAPFVAAVQVQLTVTDGVVEVAGSVSSESQRQAVLAMIEETPGVHRAIDRLTVGGWSLPSSA
ncbi:MAG: CBS domain-containing protein [Methyloceanibacter sp.]